MSESYHAHQSSRPEPANNRKKSEQLGIPHGTAVHRLRKNILFHLLQKHGENICFQCGQTIENADELSVEHKQPWQGNDTALFWDMDNIAFSHLRCNKPHNHYKPERKVGPEGTAWCCACSQFRPVHLFQKSKEKWNGLNNWCGECRVKKHREYRKRRRNKYQLRLALEE